MPLIGYARVSTEDQTPLPQSEALQTVGCVEIHEEHASGGNRARPVLARLLERISKGDMLVVVRIDRLARSLSHLLEVIERLEAKLGDKNEVISELMEENVKAKKANGEL